MTTNTTGLMDSMLDIFWALEPNLNFSLKKKFFPGLIKPLTVLLFVGPTTVHGVLTKLQK